jgi:uncharacterized protein YukE
MKSNIHFEKEGFEEILSKLKEKTEKLNSIYDEVEEKSKDIDGNSDTWHGKGQASFYKSYVSISKKFEGIKDNFQNCNMFLESTMKSYCDEDERAKVSIDKSQDNLNVN